MEELSGKAAVTGATSGNGRTLAARFAAEGMALTLADVEQEPPAEAAASLAKETEVLAVATDVSDTAAANRLRDVRPGSSRAMSARGSFDARR